MNDYLEGFQDGREQGRAEAVIVAACILIPLLLAALFLLGAP